MNTTEQSAEIAQGIEISYNMKEDSIDHTTMGATLLFGVPQKAVSLQDYLIRYGVVLPESAKAFLKIFRTACGGAPHSQGVVRVRTAKGEFKWIDISLATVYDALGNPISAKGFLTDVTERHTDATRRDALTRETFTYYEANLTRRTICFGAEEVFALIKAAPTDDYDAGVQYLINTTVHQQDRDAMQSAFSAEALLKSFAAGERRVVQEYLRLTGEGDAAWARASGYLFQEENTGDLLLSLYINDISMQMLRKTNNRERVQLDGLTGALNQATSEMRMEEMIAQDQEKGVSSAYEQNEYAFSQKLLDRGLRSFRQAESPEAAIQEVLEMVASTFGFHRGYVFDINMDGAARCVFECHAAQDFAMSEEERLLNHAQVKEWQRLLEQGDISLQRQEQGKAPDAGAPALWLLAAISNGEKAQGFVGFERFGRESALSEKQEDALCRVVRLLGAFLSGWAATKALNGSNLLLQGIVDSMSSCTYIIDAATYVIQHANRNTRELMPKAIPGRRCYEVLRMRTTPCDDCPINRMLQEGYKSEQSEMYLEQCKKWARVDASLISDTRGQTFGVFSAFDFSEQRHEKSAVAELSEFTHDTSLYDALSMSTDDYFIMCDMATKRFYFPKKMVEEFELPAQVILDAIPIWIERIHKDDRADFQEEMDLMFSGKTDTHDQEYRAKNCNGEWVWLHAKGHIERSKEGVPTLLAVVISNLGKKSKVDHLTGLLDKYEFEVSIRAQLAQGLSRGALLVLGLDNFRYINSIYGWEFGDNVLKDSSLRLLSALPDQAQLYRLDGDKFGVFFPEAEPCEVKQYYQALFQIFKKHRQLEQQRYYCTISGGCTFFQGGALTFGRLYKQATHAFENAKREGKNRLDIYDAKSMEEDERVLAMMAALHDSADQDWQDFALYFQPQISGKTKSIRSAEALLRWQSAQFGMVSPGEFIPLLEQSGLIHRIGRWVFQQAMATSKRWQEQGFFVTISINISFIQLQDQAFLPYLEKQIALGQIDPAMLHLEITESCIVGGGSQMGKAIKGLRAMGFVIEMDDFGTGYSSLEVLKNAPADVVKIDRAFVRDITRSKFDATFIQIIVQLCHSVNIPVCLEGVETMEEYRLVEPMQLDLIQGYLFGRPQPEQVFFEQFLLETGALSVQEKA